MMLVMAFAAVMIIVAFAEIGWTTPRVEPL
jgi:hypothetical protein